MTTIAVLRRWTDKLAQRWLRTGCDHARADAASRHRSRPETATLNDSLNHQEVLAATPREAISSRAMLRQGVVAE
jgi:hypothetical protein